MIFLALGSTNAHASRIVEARIFPTSNEQIFKKIETSLGQIFLNLQQGDTLIVSNAKTLEVGAVLEIPRKKAASNPKFRIRLMRKNLSQMKQFVKTLKTTEGSGSLDIPMILDDVRQRKQQYPDSEMDVLLFGNPIYKNADFSLESHFPSDGMLKADLVDSPFSILGKNQALSGVQIHVIYPSEVFKNNFHKEKTLRFYGLMIQLQQGQLITTSSDVGSWKRIAMEISPKTYVFNESDGKAEYHSAIRKRPKIFQENNEDNQTRQSSQSSGSGQTHSKNPSRQMERNQGGQTSASASNSSSTGKQTNTTNTFVPSSTIGKLEIGIIWHQKQKTQDLDIWLRNQNKWISYKYPRSEGCIHEKDYTSNAKNYWETISCQTPLDLRKLTTLVHLFSLNPNATFTIRVHFQGRRFEKTYHITQQAVQGYPLYWYPISLMEIIGFPVKESPQPKVKFTKSNKGHRLKK